MTAPDLLIVAAYTAGMLGVGLYYLRRQERTDQYFVGDRKMGAFHIGFSVVATDVGGGFSIGLGGLGFAMGLAGSWLLFTGLVGAWLAAVIVIPRVKPLADRFGWLSYPDYLEHRFDSRTRLAAAVVSAVGYGAFVGAQILAGAKLGSVAFEVDQATAVWLMAAVVVGYTALGGLQAVVLTDTVQWSILLIGLACFALPFAWIEVGGLAGLTAALPAAHFSLTNIGVLEFATWMITIVPIWFVGMTLYQRIYATRDVKTAKRAWYLAGLLEYPVMAFLGVALGMMARAMFPEVESELGLPMLIREVLPVGVTGLVIAAYFAAIMSTADSCLLASVGNLVGDLYLRYLDREATDRRVLLLSRALTLVVGFGSVAIAFALPKVIDAIMLAYSFMVSGLFVPTLAGLIWRRTSATAALWGMLVGGGLAVLLGAVPSISPVDEPILVALPASAVVLVVLSLLFPNRRALAEKEPLEA
jgi:SSS family solute:Na+ symporter